MDADLLEMANQDELLARFEREAQAVAALDHSNIRGVYDYGQVGGIPYLVMPYIGGGNLDDRLRRESRFSPEQTAFRTTPTKAVPVPQAPSLGAGGRVDGNRAEALQRPRPHRRELVLGEDAVVARCGEPPGLLGDSPQRGVRRPRRRRAHR